MRNLLMGLLEFREQSRLAYLDRFQELSEGQSPDTLFIACSDSRVVPTLLASAEPGELFTMRNVGNLIPRRRMTAHRPATCPRPAPSNMPPPSSRWKTLSCAAIRIAAPCAPSPPAPPST